MLFKVGHICPQIYHRSLENSTIYPVKVKASDLITTKTIMFDQETIG